MDSEMAGEESGQWTESGRKKEKERLQEGEMCSIHFEVCVGF